MRRLVIVILTIGSVCGCVDSSGIRVGIGDKKEISTNEVDYTEYTCKGISVFWIE